MRISIRQQLALLLLFSSLVGLAALAIATWVVNHDFVLSVASSRLRTTAVLKAAQIAANLELMQTAATFLTTRAIIQEALERYNNGSNISPGNWDAAVYDLEVTLGNVGPLTKALVLQAQIFSRNASGPAGISSVVNATGVGAGSILLPWTDPDGSEVYLGKARSGYPPALYPNLTMGTEVDGSDEFVPSYDGEPLGPGSTLVLGPLIVNATFSLISLTLPVVNNNSTSNVLGWITAVIDGRLIQLVQQDLTGLGNTGQTLLVGPVNTTNNFAPGLLGTSAMYHEDVRFLLPLNTTVAKRHPGHVAGKDNPAFEAHDYPAIALALSQDARGVDDVGSILRTHNEANKSVSVGYSIAPTDLVDWVVVVEQARSEVWEPINHLRVIILACLFAVAGFWTILSFPIAHWAVLPIIRLRAATAQTIEPPRSNSTSQGSSDDTVCAKSCDKASSKHLFARRGGFVETIARWRGKRSGGLHVEKREDQGFRIPSKVPAKKFWVQDEMSDLIETFNMMVEELYVQYSRLEERVRQRTIELEHSKKAAEAANESKTLFLANVSHELKTPLNGILGMCAVCMEEDDPSKLKQSLGIIYKSGDLLLRTLSDLLTFSTNQVGHQIMKLDEKEFCLRDFESQIYAIFETQAKDREIHLRVAFDDATSATHDNDTLRDMPLWGDIHRILQIAINLVSNALKFTPADGLVIVTIRTLSEVPPRRRSRGLPQDTVMQQSGAEKRRESRHLPESNSGTACFINPRETDQTHDALHERNPSPPPGRDIFIEMEVSDTGAGIKEEMQSRIFEPFVQADAGLSRKHSGTGLGLSICSQLASLMRGHISLTSALGKGSVFRVKLPLRQMAMNAKTSRDGAGQPSQRSSVAAVAIPEGKVLTDVIAVPISVAETAKSPGKQTTPGDDASSTRLASSVQKATKDLKASKGRQQQEQDFSKVNILVAEDNKINQEVIMRMLKLEKIYNVTLAEDGQVALDLVRATLVNPDPDPTTPSSPPASPPFDLIFMDIQMPNMDGITSTKLIRELGFTSPIVALTAYAEQRNVEDCLGSGMDYFLAKPVKRPMLKKVLTEYCSVGGKDAVQGEEEGTGEGKEKKVMENGVKEVTGNKVDGTDPLAPPPPPPP